MQAVGFPPFEDLPTTLQISTNFIKRYHFGESLAQIIDNDTDSAKSLPVSHVELINNVSLEGGKQRKQKKRLKKLTFVLLKKLYFCAMKETCVLENSDKREHLQPQLIHPN